MNILKLIIFGGKYNANRLNDGDGAIKADSEYLTTTALKTRACCEAWPG